MLVSLLALLMAAQPLEQIPDGTQLTYRGQFAADRGDPGTTEKSFELTFVVARESGGAALYWTLQERGRGGWTWLDRFGKLLVDSDGRPVGGVGPSLLYERSDGTSVVNVTAPLLAYKEPLAPGLSWLERGLEHSVSGSEKTAGTDAWRVEVRSPIGRKRSLAVDKTSPVVVALTETVFVGQGEQHTLRYELVGRATLDDAPRQAAVAAFGEWLRLRERLEIEPRSREVTWTADRLARLRADLPGVVEKAQNTLLAGFAQAAEQQAKAEKDKSNALAALRGNLVGKSSPQPKLEDLTGNRFSWADTAGKVTVLHFWEYRDMPLEEPYGQVAYLDFLFRKHAGGAVQMYGVVSDERVSQAETRRAGIQSARRLHSFMNLSYPLLVDTGDGARQFGDPRVTGAKLPLIVVIDRVGRIVHYHVGHYEVDRDRGLEELERVVKQALESRG